QPDGVVDAGQDRVVGGERGPAAEVVVPVRRPFDLHVPSGQEGFRSCDRYVLLRRGCRQVLVVVGPRLVVFAEVRQQWVGEDGGQLLQPAPRLEREPVASGEPPSAAPSVLILIRARVPLARTGLDVVEPDVLDPGTVGPRLLAGDRAG